MSNVNDYVNQMRKSSTQSAGVAKGDMGRLELELVEFYRTHIRKAIVLVDSVEDGSTPISSPEHAMHYRCASNVVKGMQPMKQPNPPPEAPVDAKKRELSLLQAKGWRSLEEQKTPPTQLLTEN